MIMKKNRLKAAKLRPVNSKLDWWINRPTDTHVITHPSLSRRMCIHILLTVGQFKASERRPPDGRTTPYVELPYVVANKLNPHLIFQSIIIFLSLLAIYCDSKTDNLASIVSKIKLETLYIVALCVRKWMS